MNRIPHRLSRVVALLAVLLLVMPSVAFAAQGNGQDGNPGNPQPIQGDGRGHVPAAAPNPATPGRERVDQYTTRQSLGTTSKTIKVNGKDVQTHYNNYSISVSSLPQTTADGSTVDTHWYLLSDISGQAWFESGINTFKAKVQGGRVSVAGSSGKLTGWDTLLTIGGISCSGGIPVIVDDPINPNYSGNTLKWDYGAYKTSDGGTANIVRYLRVIEGYVSELWDIPKQPASGVVVKLTRSTEPGFNGNPTWISAWDNAGRGIPVSLNPAGLFVISSNDLSNRTYPVWIDPSQDFTASSDSGEISANSFASYVAARTSATGTVVSSITGSLGQWVTTGPYWQVDRFMAMFDTSAVPDNATVTAAAVELYGYGSSPDNNFNITVQNGVTATYPHQPPVAADFNYTNYQGNGGELTTSGWSNAAYNPLLLNATGMSWVNLTGWTKFMLFSSDDVNNLSPGNGSAYVNNTVTIRTLSFGAGYAPFLTVVYSVPVVAPTVTTQSVVDSGYAYGVLRGLLSSDGGEACSVQFQYDVSTAYSYATAWRPASGSPNFVTGNAFSATVNGLTPGELYYYRAAAANGAGTGYGSGGTFLTNPSFPTGVTLTPGNAQVILSWTKGAGAQTTVIRRSSAGYPDTPASGTSVYFSTGTTVTDNASLVNGTLYYYSIWSYTTLGGLTAYSLDRITGTATPSPPALATIVTNAATSVGATTANLNMSLTNLGGYGSADLSFDYATNAYYIAHASTYSDNVPAVPVTATTIGTLSEPLAGLAAATLYHFRAKAQNISGFAYGADLTFTTGSTSAPTMTTNAATGVLLLSATINGAVTSDGGAPPVTVWFEWGLTVAYERGATPSKSGLATGAPFYFGLTGLSPSTTYHFRTVGSNSKGTAYGADATFTTSNPLTPTVETVAATGVGTHQVTLNGQVLTDGGVSDDVRFEYATDAYYIAHASTYSNNTSWVSGNNAGQAFSTPVAELAISTVYHFRAEARNATGTGNGSDTTFTTVFTAPSGFAAKATSYTTINLTWTPKGDQTYIRYSVAGYPVDRTAGTLAYFGTASGASVSGLVAGTTYYFEAWSWAQGDTWAPTTSTAVATTLAAIVPGAADTPPTVFGGITATPPNWTSNASGAKLAAVPGITALQAAQTANQIPDKTFYPGLAMLVTVIAIVFGVLLSISTNAAFGSNIPTNTIGLTFGLLAIWICAWLGMVSYFIAIVFFILAGGVMFVLKRRSGED